jgi:formate hydrogenlyase transcriptional activator
MATGARKITLEGPCKGPLQEGTGLKERLEFERLLLDISASVVNRPPREVDLAINSALQRILTFFNVDRCGLLRISSADQNWRVTHIACRPGIDTVPIDTDLPLSLFPFGYERLVQNEIFCFETPDELPNEPAADRQTALDWGIRSSLNIPIKLDTAFTYVIALNAMNNACVWPRDQFPRLRLLGEIFAGVLERKRTRMELETQLTFKELLSQVSSKLINLPPDLLDEEIEGCLREMVEFFKLDRCAMVRSMHGKTSWQIAYAASAEGVPPIPLGIDLPRSISPWVYDRLACKREVFSCGRLEELPPEAEVDRLTLSEWGIRSNLSIPIILRESTDWVIAANMVYRERDWPEEVIRQLRLLGEILAGALERRAADLSLRESEEWLKLAASAAGAGLWVMFVASGHIWATTQFRELLGFSAEEEITFARLIDAVHPDDRGRIRSAMEQSIANMEQLEQVECRILSEVGSTRWIVARGRSYPGKNGTAERVMGVAVDVTDRKTMEEDLRQRVEEITQLKRQLEEENLYLRDEIMLQHGHEEIVGRSAAMNHVLSQVEQVAKTDATVLLLGETGTGKELLAHTIHRLSKRRDRSMVTINCAVLPPMLIESELFGRERGAYTGAMTRMAGRFELADRSTLFLDEIGELPIDLQAKLLRFLEEGTFARLGSTKSLKVDVRVIAATNRDLTQEVATGRFRRDLFYRLNVFPISIPPLRERIEDIPPLVWSFVKQYEKKLNKQIEHIPRKSMENLQKYQWPGNARELRNIVEHAMIISQGETLRLSSPSHQLQGDTSADSSLIEVERKHILNVLSRTGWRLAGKDGAAEILGLKRTTLNSKIRKLQIQRPKK